MKFTFASRTGRGMVTISAPNGIADVSPDPAAISRALCGLNPGQVIAVHTPTRGEITGLCRHLDPAALDRVKITITGDRVTFTRRLRRGAHHE